MGNAMILALRIVIALALIGSVVVQVMIVPAIWLDLVGAPLPARAFAWWASLPGRHRSSLG